MNLKSEFKAVRTVGTPLVAITTTNQPDTIRELSKENNAPQFRWDVINGLRPINDKAQTILADVTQGNAEMSSDPVAVLEMLGNTTNTVCVFAVNMHSFISDARVSTGVGNLREHFKSTGSTFVMLAPAFTMPPELVQDVVLLADALPDDTKLADVVSFVEKQCNENGINTNISDDDRESAVSALRGLSAFNAEQQAFLSMRLDSGELDLDSLWSRKVQAVNAVDGLEMQYKKTSADAVRGLDALVDFFNKLFRPENKNRPQLVLHVDEIDKSLAGFGNSGTGDSSGVTQDQVGQLLQTMEDKGWSGAIPVGPPGVGKTLISKTVAGLHGVPYIRLDMGQLKGSLVGQSEQLVRAALDTINRVGNGRVFVMATCNRLESLPPELKRRFTAGIWYFDLPDSTQRAPIWDLYCEQYGIDRDEATALEADFAQTGDWLTGAEIRNVCRTSSELGISLADALNLIVPVAKSGATDIRKLRDLASGNFLDAARGGTYNSNDFSNAPTGRKLQG